MRKLLAIALCLMLLSGCQLAQTSQGETPLEDRLVGVFVTQDYLDLLDLETCLQEHPEDFLDGTLELSEQGKLYATMSDDGTFRFEGCEGMYLCSYLLDGVQRSFTTEGFGDVVSKHTATDTGRVVEESATIRITGTEGVVFYTNPVYQTADGQYYVTSGQGAQSNGHGTMTHSLDETNNWEESGEKRTYQAKFTVAVTYIHIPDSISLLQMSADNRELTRTEYAPGQMPETLEALPDTAYLLMESKTGTEITRTLFQPGDDAITTWYKTESPVCLPQFTEVIWP